jgi:hypothetical protein
MGRVQHARDIAGWHAFTLVSGFPRDDASLAVIAHWHISKARLYLYIPPFESMCHCLLICERQHGVFALSSNDTEENLKSRYARQRAICLSAEDVWGNDSLCLIFYVGLPFLMSQL